MSIMIVYLKNLARQFFSNGRVCSASASRSQGAATSVVRLNWRGGRSALHKRVRLKGGMGIWSSIGDSPCGNWLPKCHQLVTQCSLVTLMPSYPTLLF